MRRYLEFLMVLAVCAIAVTFFARSGSEGVSQPTTPTPVATPSSDQYLALNRVKIGDSLVELEKTMGPPDFSWPKKNSVQWEPKQGRFTRVFYRVDDSGDKFVIRVEASGILTRGSERLVGFGDPKAQMLSSLGDPLRVEDGFIYWYPGVSLSCQDLVGMIILEGSEKD